MILSGKSGKTVLSGLAGGLALLGAATVQAQEISRGAVIASTCYTCHGTYGVSPGSIPPIDDISAERMISTLQGYRSGQRASTVMGRHASGYTDEEIREVAQYFGNLQKRGK